MSRSKPIWRGKTDDSMPPQSVRLRIFAAHDGRCHWSGVKINVGDLWDLDHIKALEDGGDNVETNLAPIRRDKHREKTAAENSRRAKADRTFAKHIGTFPKSKRPLQGRGFEPSRPRSRTGEA